MNVKVYVSVPFLVLLNTDVFSYDEDDMVEDPYLAKHLAHWGINIAAMQKVSL